MNGTGRLEGKHTTGGGLEAGCHHLLCNDVTVEWNHSGLPECCTDEIGGECLHVHLSVDSKKVGLRDLLACAFESGAGSHPLSLQDTEDNDIESLEDMHAMRRVA